MIRPGSIPELLGSGDNDSSIEEEGQEDGRTARDPLSTTGVDPVSWAAHMQSVLDLADEMDSPHGNKGAESTDDSDDDVESVL